jgi:predicted transcriptional regulator
MFTLPSVEEIKRRRNLLDLTQARLADAVELDEQTISRMETKYHIPSYETVKKITDFLDKEWLRQRSGRPVTIGEICHCGVVWAEITDTIDAVIGKMKDGDFSQLPVRKNNASFGSVTESSLLQVVRDATASERAELLTQPLRKHDNAIGRHFDAWPKDARAEGLISTVQKQGAVLVTDDGTVVGIATKIDFLKLLKPT